MPGPEECLYPELMPPARVPIGSPLPFHRTKAGGEARKPLACRPCEGESPMGKTIRDIRYADRSTRNVLDLMLPDG